MQRKKEIRYLIPILSVICMLFFLTYLSFIDKNITYLLITKDGTLDISDYFLNLFPNVIYGILFSALFLLVHLYLRIKLPEADPLILPAVALLSGIGAILLFRLSPELASSRNEAIQSILSNNPDAYVKNNVLTLAQLGMKHFIFVVIGTLVMIALINLSNKRTFSWFSSKKYFWVFLSAIFIATTLLFGKEINERRLWLFGFQTVELVKVMMLFFIAGYIYEKGKGIYTYRNTGFSLWLQYAGPFVAMWFFGLIPIFIQKDIGPTFLIFIIFLFMLYYAGTRNKVVILFLLLVVAVGCISYMIGVPSIVRERFDMLFDPFGQSESMSRALWALSSGGIFGTGIGYGQPYRIPIVQSDYNFAAICEEMGFLGGIAVVFCYVIFVHRCYRISQKTANIYKRVLVFGIAALIGLQAFTIICGNLGIIPMTGITLPFVSYGGSSMIVNFLLTGIVLKISGERDV
jgi:cell division protein FtsW (lipid II flippase)